MNAKIQNYKVTIVCMIDKDVDIMSLTIYHFDNEIFSHDFKNGHKMSQVIELIISPLLKDNPEVEFLTEKVS